MALRNIAFGLVFAVLLVGSVAGTAQANLFISYSFDLQTKSGADLLGIGGATLTLDMEFDDTATYIDRFGLPVIDALSHTLTITGASVGSTNGSYSDVQGIGFYATFEGQVFSGGPTNGFSNFNVNGENLQLLRLTNEVSGVNVGDQIDLSHFGTTMFDVTGESFGNWRTTILAADYEMTNFSSSFRQGDPIPEPTTLALLGLGLAGVGYQRRRKAARATK